MRSVSDETDSPRPMSEISEVSMDFGNTTGRKRVKAHGDKQRPLTRYLPIKDSDLDLRQHIESAGNIVKLYFISIHKNYDGEIYYKMSLY
jgi:hypothetical protein